MKIAVIGSGNVGGALAKKWAQKGHEILLGVRDVNNFKGKELLSTPSISAMLVADAVANAEVILLATPAPLAVEIAQSLGNTEGKVIIDSMNIVMGRGPVGYTNTSDVILAYTNTKDVVKCFNTTGFNNMENPVYNSEAIEVFVAGDSEKGKEIAKQLALDAGFADCINVGGNDKFTLMEQFAFFWINLAMFQGQGRDIAFKFLRR